MTQNQLAYLAHMENVRANQAREAETQRSNLAKETETHRSNLVHEGQGDRSITETERANRSKEKETSRHNRTTEVISAADVIRRALGDYSSNIRAMIDDHTLSFDELLTAFSNLLG